jgi:hypothetical protein
MLNRFNVWFDSLKEPRRFLIFLAMTLGWYAPLGISEFLPDPYRLIFLIIGGIGVVVMMVICVSRVLPSEKESK